VGNIGLTFGTHYCGGQAVLTEIILGNGDLSCGMPDLGSSCESIPQGLSVSEKGCCENQYVTVDIEGDFDSSLKHPTLEAKFVFAIAYTILDLHYAENEHKIAYFDYLPPPPLEQDVQTLLQTFLI